MSFSSPNPLERFVRGFSGKPTATGWDPVHVAAWEQLQLLSEDVRATFRSLR